MVPAVMRVVGYSTLSRPTEEGVDGLRGYLPHIIGEAVLFGHLQELLQRLR